MPKIATNFIEIHICYIKGSSKKYLLLKRSKRNKIYPGIWQMITATVEPKERTKNAILREVKEETGLVPEKIFVVPRVNTFYHALSDVVCLSSVFLVIVNNNNAALSKEHDEYKWVSFKQAIKLIYWDNQIDSLRLIENLLKNKNSFKKMVEL